MSQSKIGRKTFAFRQRLEFNIIISQKDSRLKALDNIFP
uniref:Uncharacterized protein n=1 Tax=uncultured Desulfobacterium sp. TaxID=201089 RepID=E1YE23_9BACT|nr:unknown protein [uncultured Desulfobacterium sp.]